MNHDSLVEIKAKCNFEGCDYKTCNSQLIRFRDNVHNTKSEITPKHQAEFKRI